MKGVKGKVFNIRKFALFISIFMFISLFSNITVKADELENVEVNSVISEEADIQNNEESPTENELLIPEDTTEYENAQDDENDVLTKEVSAAEETEEQDEKEEMELTLLVNDIPIGNEDKIKVHEDDDIHFALNYKTKEEKAGEEPSIEIPSFIDIKEFNYSKEDFIEESIIDNNTVSLIFNEKFLNEGERYNGSITISGTIKHTEDVEVQTLSVNLNGEIAYRLAIEARPKVSTEPNPQNPVEEVFKGSVELTNVERGNNDKVLSGSMFILLNENLENIGDIYTTDEQGKIVVNDLVEGTYYFVEIAPKTGYVLDVIPVEFTISKDNKDMVLVIKENELLPEIATPTIDSSNLGTMNKLSNISMTSNSNTNNSIKYTKTLPNTGGNSKAVALVIGVAVIVVGLIFVRKNEKNKK